MSFIKIDGLSRDNSSDYALDYLLPLDQVEIKKFLQSKRISFIGLARDCEKTVRVNLQIIDILGTFFKSSDVLILENDSIDSTRDQIKMWSESSQHKVTLPNFKGLSNTLKKRTERLAYLRNYALDYISSELSDIDYVAVLDLDGMIARNIQDFSFEGFFDNFSFNDVWDAVFPSPTSYYYDIWAFRHPFICPHDYRVISKEAPAILGMERIVALSALSRQIVTRSLNGWLEVDSAFGGMGIYKRHALDNVRYIGLNSEGDEICEHVSLHSGMKDKGLRLFINPKFATLGDNTLSRAVQLKSLLGL